MKITLGEGRKRGMGGSVDHSCVDEIILAIVYCIIINFILNIIGALGFSGATILYFHLDRNIY